MDENRKLTPEEINKIIHDRQCEYRRRWYNSRPEEKKIASRIKYARRFLARNGLLVLPWPPDGPWDELTSKAILKAVEKAVERAEEDYAS